MKNKKVKNHNIELFIYDEPPDASNQVYDIYQSLTSAKSFQDQIISIEKLETKLKDGSDNIYEHAFNLLIDSILQLDLKSQLRSKMVKCLTTVKFYSLNDFQNCMELKITTLNQSCNRLKLLNLLLILNEGQNPQINNTLNEESVHILILKSEEMIKEFWGSFKSQSYSTSEIEPLLQQTHQLVKSFDTFIDIYPTNQLKIKNALEHLLPDLFLMIEDSICPLDLRMSCGHLVVMIYSCLELSVHDYPIEYFLQFVELEHKCKPNVCFKQLAIIHGILSLFNQWNNGRQKQQQIVYVKILKSILNCAKMSKNSDISLTCARLAYQWLLKIYEFYKIIESDIVDENSKYTELYQDVWPEILDYIWISWENHLDSIKHLTKDIFQLFLKLQYMINPQLVKDKLNGMVNNFLSAPSLGKYQMKAICCMLPYMEVSFIVNKHENLIIKLVSQLMEPNLSRSSFELIENLFTLHFKETELNNWLDFWSEIFITNFTKEMYSFGFESLLKKFILLNPKSVFILLNKNTWSDELSMEKSCVLLMYLKISRDILKETLDKNDMWKGLIEYTKLKLCLNHYHYFVQDLTFALICNSSKSTELFEQKELDIILDFYQYNIIVEDPSARQHLLSNSKKMLLRIKYGTNIYRKKEELTEDENQILLSHEDFLLNLQYLLLNNLYPNASFVRKNSSLEILKLIKDYFWMEEDSLIDLKKQPFYKYLLSSLLSNLDDPYEINKVLILNILIILDINELQNKNINELMHYWKSLASSSKPPDIETASHLIIYLARSDSFSHELSKISNNTKEYSTSIVSTIFSILNLLREEISVAQKNLLLASATQPMYGLLSSLKGLVNYFPINEISKEKYEWVTMVNTILELAFEVQTLVFPVVKDCSPEGHLPDNFEDGFECLSNAVKSSVGYQQDESDLNLFSDSPNHIEIMKAQAVTSQLLLLCSWRSIKEISLLFGILIEKILPLQNNNEIILSYQQILKIINYFIDQLSESKHRGAFEQTYVGFKKVCQQLWNSTVPELNVLPQQFIDNALASITNDSNADLCATRRSAGLPFIVVSVLSTEPQFSGKLCFNKTMEKLFIFASLESKEENETKVHACNILRAIFKDSSLGRNVLGYVSRALQIAIDGCESKYWICRNASTLLFSALINRIFGVKKTADDLDKENSMSALTFFKQYPEMYDYFHDKFPKYMGSDSSSTRFGLYFTLSIFARLTPAPLEGRSSPLMLSSFVPAIIDCFGSPVSAIRTLAAKALVPLIRPPNHIFIVKELCQLASFENYNRLDGILRCLYNILISEYIVQNKDYQKPILEQISAQYWILNPDPLKPCMFNMWYGVKLFDKIYEYNADPKICELLENTANWYIFSENKYKHDPGYAQFKICLIKFVLKNTKVEESLLRKLLNDPDFEVRLVLLENLKYIEIPDLIFNDLLSHTLIEKHTGCLSLLYQVIEDYIQENGISSFQNTDQQLQHLKEKGELENQFDIYPSIISLMSTLSQSIIQKETKINPTTFNVNEVLDKSIETYKIFSCCDQTQMTRLVTVKSMTGLIPFYAQSGISFQLKFIEILIYQLQDDDVQIKQLACENAHIFLKATNVAKTLNIACENPYKMLQKIFLFVADAKCIVGYEFLIKTCFECCDNEDFNLEFDRVFDKSEVTLYKEPIEVVKIISNIFNSNLNDENFKLTYEFVKTLDIALAEDFPNQFLNRNNFIALIKHSLSNDLNILFNCDRIQVFKNKLIKSNIYAKIIILKAFNCEFKSDHLRKLNEHIFLPIRFKIY